MADADEGEIVEAPIDAPHKHDGGGAGRIPSAQRAPVHGDGMKLCDDGAQKRLAASSDGHRRGDSASGTSRDGDRHDRGHDKHAANRAHGSDDRDKRGRDDRKRSRSRSRSRERHRSRRDGDVDAAAAASTGHGSRDGQRRDDDRSRRDRSRSRDRARDGRDRDGDRDREGRRRDDDRREPSGSRQYDRDHRDHQLDRHSSSGGGAGVGARPLPSRGAIDNMVRAALPSDVAGNRWAPPAASAAVGASSSSSAVSRDVDRDRNQRDTRDTRGDRRYPAADDEGRGRRGDDYDRRDGRNRERDGDRRRDDRDRHDGERYRDDRYRDDRRDDRDRRGRDAVPASGGAAGAAGATKSGAAAAASFSSPPAGQQHQQQQQNNQSKDLDAGTTASEYDDEADEETHAARLLEESKRRRAEIMAKYKQQQQQPQQPDIGAADVAAAPVVAPSAAAVAPASAPAPSLHAAPAAVSPAASTSAIAAPVVAPAAAPAVVKPGTKLGAPTTTTSTTTLSASASTAPAAAPSMFDDDDETWDEAVAGRGAGGRLGAGGGGQGIIGISHTAMTSGAGAHHGALGLAAAAAAGAHDGGGGHVHDASAVDDGEGYYRARTGELLGGRYQVLGTRGRGVFSSVLYCRDTEARVADDASAGGGGAGDDDSTLDEVFRQGGEVKTVAAPMAVGSTGALVKQHAALQTGTSSFVAIKVIRSNDTMRRAGAKEVEILRTLATADPTSKYHCVRLLHTIEHNNHLCLVFEPLSMNLKEVQNKFGKGVGLSIRAVREYAKQLLLALGLLAKLHIVHADIKPHNILANERFNVIKLADFGSAFREDDADNEPTPYLVSRFYRSPEIILGYKHSPAIDMWSAACVLWELYTGSPLFPGVDNNDMLNRFHNLRGRFPHKMLRRHLQHSSQVGIEPHYEDEGNSFRFRRHVIDPVSKAPGIKLLDVTTPTEDLHTKLFSHRAEGDDKRAVHDLASLLDRMLTLDPARRISVKEALQHPFVRPSTGAGHKAVGHKAHTGCEPTTAAAGAGGAGAASSAAVAAAASFSS